MVPGDASHCSSFAFLSIVPLHPAIMRVPDLTVDEAANETLRREVRARQAAEDLLAATLAGIRHGVILTDAKGTITLVNAEAERLFGFARAELLDKPIGSVLPARFRAHHLDLTRQCHADSRERVMRPGRDLFGLCKNGAEVPIEIALNPLRTVAGDFVLTSIVDVTGKRRAEEVQQRMSALVESADDAILSKTLDGIIRSWNPAAERLLGYRAEEVIGRPVLLLLPEDRQEEEAMILGKVRRGERVAHFETVRRRRDGSLIDVSLTISPIRDRAGNVTGASKIMRDITERRQSMIRLQRLNAELEAQVEARTLELREREAMLQEIHHRVKNNLTVVSSLINMQIRSIGDEQARGALRQCRSRVATMAQIHEMLYQSEDYARVPFWKYARDLTVRVLGASGMAPESIALRFALEKISLPVAKAIPCGLILNELVANSLKHAFPSAAGGSIAVELRRLPDRRILLSVSDDGIGGEPGPAGAKPNSVGVQLVRALARQLDAQISIIPDPGMTCQLVFAAE